MYTRFRSLLDPVFPRGDLLGHLPDLDRVVRLAFQQVYREPPPLVGQYVEQIVLGDLRRRLYPSPADLLCRRH